MTPYLQFPGHIVYAASLADIQAVCSHLLQSISSSKRMIMGFDMEWAYMPTEKPVALIQLCARVTAEQPALLLLPSGSGVCISSTAGQQQDPAAARQHSDHDTEQEKPVKPPAAKRLKHSSAKHHMPETVAAHNSEASQGSVKGMVAAAMQSRPLATQEHEPDTALQQQQQQEQDAQLVCYLLHLARLGPTAQERAVPELKELLEHPKVFLVTAGDRDEEKLQQDLDIAPSNLEQVNMMHFLLQAELEAAGKPVPQRMQQRKRKQNSKAQQQHQQQQFTQSQDGPPQPHIKREVISLAALVGLYLHKRLDKSCQTANEAWEENLTDRCKQYAAVDAYAQLLVFECIKATLRTLMIPKKM